MRALVIGSPDLAGEFQKYLEHYGAKVDLLGEAAELSPGKLELYAILVLCAPMDSEAPELTPEQSDALLHFIEGGGRAFVEYTRVALPGWDIAPEPLLSRFENIVVLEDDVVRSGLEKDDLLEEHNSYLLQTTPPSQAATLLQYGLYMGTYKVAWEIKDGAPGFTITVDLGEGLPLVSAEQQYGGLEPNYAPDLVRLSIAGDDLVFQPAGELLSKDLDNLKAVFPLDGKTARYVRFHIEKERKSPVTDYIVLNGIRVYDIHGKNVAKDQPYTLRRGNDAHPKVERALTGGEEARPWSDDRSHLYPVSSRRDLNKKRWDALVRWDYGKGRLYYAATSLSTFRKNNYRLTRRWETLVRGLSLSLFPEERQEEVARRWLPLRVYTLPHRWSLPGASVALHIESVPGASIEAACEHADFGPFEEVEAGHLVSRSTPPEGDHTIRVEVARAAAWNEGVTRLSVFDRKTMYRRALDRNMKWFVESGVLPKQNGAAGVKSTLEIGALYAGAVGDLPSPFRQDCQAMTGKAFYMYGDVSGDGQWHERAENLARNMMQYQFTDPSEPSFGAWPWLFEGSDAIYPQDDHNRNAEFLAWLYTRTGNEAYLEAALRTVEFIRDTAREDFTLAYWVTTPEALRKKGRAHLRTIYAFDNFSDWCLYRDHYAYRATGDAGYLQSIRDLARIYGGLTLCPDMLAALPGGGGFQRLSQRGMAVAVSYLPDKDPLRRSLIDACVGEEKDYFEREDVKKYGSGIQPNDISPIEIERAFTNDCTIHTWAGEPLSDQLYATAKGALMLWEAYSAMPNGVTRGAVESALDYLVRIQFDNPDPRLDGCWLRGFDMENWEYYGTRYDPNYGAYHAYTGWMNATASTALAYYLLDESPFRIEAAWHRKGKAVLDEVLGERMPEYRIEVNYLRGVPLEANREPDLGSKTAKTITDGIIEGVYGDGLSSGWTVPAGAGKFAIVLEGDLGRSAQCCRMSIRLGGLSPACSPDRIKVHAGESADTMTEVLDAKPASGDGINWFEFDRRSFRYIRITLSKRHTSDQPTAMYVGEIQALGVSSSGQAATP